MPLNRKRLIVLGLVGCCALSGALAGARLASGGQTQPLAAFSSTTAPSAADPNGFIQSLADDVGNVPPGVTNHMGQPLVGEARNLITNAGAAHDTLSAFPTSTGGVCFEVRAAGSCGNPSTDPSGAGITWGILSIRSTGTRVYGVASDEVVKVDVEIDGVNHPATLNNSGFYYQVPDGLTGDDVQQIVATWKDGSVHQVSVR